MFHLHLSCQTGFHVVVPVIGHRQCTMFCGTVYLMGYDFLASHTLSCPVSCLSGVIRYLNQRATSKVGVDMGWARMEELMGMPTLGRRSWVNGREIKRKISRQFKLPTILTGVYAFIKNQNMSLPRPCHEEIGQITGCQIVTCTTNDG